MPPRCSSSYTRISKRRRSGFWGCFLLFLLPCKAVMNAGGAAGSPPGGGLWRGGVGWGGALPAFPSAAPREVTAAPLFPLPSSRNEFVFPLPPNPLSVSPVGPSSAFLPLHRLFVLFPRLPSEHRQPPTLNVSARE